jgi:hypothetical protein
VGAKKKTSVGLSVFNSSKVCLSTMPIVLLVKRDTPCTCTSILLVVEGIQWKGYTLHVNTAGGGRDTPCTSILLVMEMDTPCWCILLSVVEKDTLCTPKIQVWKGIHPARPYTVDADVHIHGTVYDVGKS